MAAEQPAATHPVCCWDKYRHIQGRTSSLEGQAYRHSHLNVPIYSCGNTRNTLCTLLQSSASSSRRGWTQSVGSLEMLLWGSLRRWRISLKPLGPGTLSSRMLMFRPARWRLSRPNRYSKNPRRLTMRQSPRRTSSWGTSCPAMHSPNGIAIAVRCTSVIVG